MDVAIAPIVTLYKISVLILVLASPYTCARESTILVLASRCD